MNNKSLLQTATSLAIDALKFLLLHSTERVLRISTIQSMFLVHLHLWINRVAELVNINSNLYQAE